MSVDVRKSGIWMVGLGFVAMSAGLITDALRHTDDETLASKEAVFDLSSFAHALFFGGIAVAFLGLLAVAFGARVYAPSQRVTVGRRILQVGAPLAAVALIAAGALVIEQTDLAEASGDGDQAAAADDGHGHDHGDDDSGDGAVAASDGDGHDHGDGHDGDGDADATAAAADHGTIIEGTATGDSPCEIASPTPASPGQIGTGEAGSKEVIGEHGHRGMVKPEPLTREERAQLEEQIRQARSVIDQFPTVADAEAAGYKMSTAYVPCIGAHYTNVGLVATFDPAKPSELLYDGTNPDSRIVGLSYLVWHRGGPPEGFAGSNDHWHQHNANGGLCFGPGAVVIGGEEMSRERCEAIGGTKRELTDIWMVHAWVAPGFECSWGIFAGECPELGGRTGGTAWDEPDPEAELARREET